MINRLLIIFTLLFISASVHANYQSGLDAYNKGQYQLAMEEWKDVIVATQGTVSPAQYTETHYAIGMLYLMGQGVGTNHQTALSWLKIAAGMGHGGAQGKLGYMYAEGLAVKQDFETAFEWFSKAAAQGDIDGQYNLGVFYLNGWGTQQDTTKASHYLSAAAEQGDKNAEALLSDLHATMEASAALAASRAVQAPPPAPPVEVARQEEGQSPEMLAMPEATAPLVASPPPKASTTLDETTYQQAPAVPEEAPVLVEPTAPDKIVSLQEAPAQEDPLILEETTASGDGPILIETAPSGEIVPLEETDFPEESGPLVEALLPEVTKSEEEMLPSEVAAVAVEVEATMPQEELAGAEKFVSMEAPADTPAPVETINLGETVVEEEVTPLEVLLPPAEAPAPVETILLDETMPQEDLPLQDGGAPTEVWLAPAETLPLQETAVVEEDLPVQPSADLSIFLLTTWILEQNPNHYTIQVMGLGSKETLARLVRDYNDYRPFAVYTLHLKKEPLHVLVQGVYIDVETARMAKRNFPAAIQNPENVWIRKFGKIQELVNLEEVSN